VSSFPVPLSGADYLSSLQADRDEDTTTADKKRSALRWFTTIIWTITRPSPVPGIWRAVALEARVNLCEHMRYRPGAQSAGQGHRLPFGINAH
jgi:hypothetical protein